MELLLYYVLFAVTTALSAIYQILMPVISFRQTEGHIVESKFVVYATFFVLTILFAPVIFFSCIVPSMCNRFQGALYKGLFPKD